MTTLTSLQDFQVEAHTFIPRQVLVYCLFVVTLIDQLQTCKILDQRWNSPRLLDQGRTMPSWSPCTSTRTGIPNFGQGAIFLEKVEDLALFGQVKILVVPSTRQFISLCYLIRYLMLLNLIRTHSSMPKLSPHIPKSSS